MFMNHDQTKYTRDQCDKVYRRNSLLKDHIDTKHKGIVKVYDCDKCAKS